MCGVKPVSLFLRVLEEAKRVWLPIKNTKAGEYRDRHEPPCEGEAEEKSRNTHGDKDGAPQAHEKRKLPSRQPAQTGCFSAKSDQHSAASPTGILGKRMSCITAHTIVKQLVSKVQSVNLIGTLSHEASQAFNGIGAADVAMHDGREGIKRQQMLFIFHQATHLIADSAGDIWRVLASRFEPGILFLLLLPDARQFGGDLLVLSFGNGVQDIPLFMHQARLS